MTFAQLQHMRRSGEMISNRYRLLVSLGEGAMGWVWSARDTLMGVDVAIKGIVPTVASTAIGRARFEREVLAAGMIESKHAVRVLDHGTDPTAGPFFVMELLRGETLAALLKRRSTIALAELVPIYRQIGEALQQAHDIGVLHRDVKPSNIFLAEDRGHRWTAKLLDFGVAKTSVGHGDRPNLTAEGHLVGTVSHMSPEQIQNHRLDKRTDIWALGVTAFEAVVGLAPFDPCLPFGQLVLQICLAPMPVPSHFNPTLPRAFDAWFARATARDIHARTASVSELVAEMEVFMDQPLPAQEQISAGVRQLLCKP